MSRILFLCLLGIPLAYTASKYRQFYQLPPETDDRPIWEGGSVVPKNPSTQPNRISQLKCAEYCAKIQSHTSPLLRRFVRATETQLHTFVVGGKDSLKDEFPHMNVRNIVHQGSEFQGRSPRHSLLKPDVFISVAGGENSRKDEFPHMVALGYGDPANGKKIGWNNCGGTLISHDFVLTAAHCTHSTIGKPTIVRLGALNVNALSNKKDKPEDIRVSQVIVHPQYKPDKSLYNDIALLKLQKRVVFRTSIQPACLSDEKNVGAKQATATGWGLLGFAEAPSDILQKVQLDIIPNTDCRKLHGSDPSILPKGISSTQLCAGVLAGGKDTCTGDSGGPLQIPNSQLSRPCGMKIIGITSFGKFCAEANSPGVYTRVSEYVPWIENIVWPTQKKG